MNTWEILLLGLVQGLTEFLPVSSSGHLALLRSLLGFAPETGASLEIALHAGTLLSILAVFRRETGALLADLPLLLRPGRYREHFATRPAFRAGVLILVSMIPAGALGILFKDRIASLFDRPAVVGACLIATGLLLASLRYAPKGRLPVSFRSAILMGFAQACALLPGISRSGSTIAAGLWAGCDRAEAGRFAFLMAIPPIAGAALLEALSGLDGRIEILPLLLGLAVAFLSGTGALLLLLRFIRGGSLPWFAPYCIAAGLLAIAI